MGCERYKMGYGVVQNEGKVVMDFTLRQTCCTFGRRRMAGSKVGLGEECLEVRWIWKGEVESEGGRRGRIGWWLRRGEDEGWGLVGKECTQRQI